MTIVNSKRVMTVEKVTEIDEKYLHLNVKDYNCVAVVSSQTYNSVGVMFEYTQSRHRPDHFRFYDNALRRCARLITDSQLYGYEPSTNVAHKYPPGSV